MVRKRPHYADSMSQKKTLNKSSYERDSAVLLTTCEGTLYLEMHFPWVGENSSVTWKLNEGLKTKTNEKQEWCEFKGISTLNANYLWKRNLKYMFKFLSLYISSSIFNAFLFNDRAHLKAVVAFLLRYGK